MQQPPGKASKPLQQKLQNHSSSSSLKSKLSSLKSSTNLTPFGASASQQQPALLTSLSMQSMSSMHSAMSLQLQRSAGSSLGSSGLNLSSSGSSGSLLGAAVSRARSCSLAVAEMHKTVAGADQQAVADQQAAHSKAVAQQFGQQFLKVSAGWHVDKAICMHEVQQPTQQTTYEKILYAGCADSVTCMPSICRAVALYLL